MAHFGTSEDHAADWIPLMDYAMKNGVSLSTLRRHIKAKKIPYRLENGRYLILASRLQLQTPTQSPTQYIDGHRPAYNESSEAIALRTQLQKAQEEIAELKTLIALYEEKTLSPNRANV